MSKTFNLSLATNLKIQSPDEFFDDLIATIRQATKSVYIHSMNFESGRYVDTLVAALLEALGRGVKVRLEIDWVYQHYANGHVAIIHELDQAKKNSLKKVLRDSNQLLENLVAAGAKLNINNQPSFPQRHFKISGRDHRKIYSVDDSVLWWGGINLYDGAFEKVDCMCRLDDPNVVEQILSKESEAKERVITFSDATFLQDSGSPGKSVIFSTALDEIKKAKKSIVFVSQFLPDHFFIRHLEAAAKRGVKVSIYTSNKLDKKFTELPGSLLFTGTVNRLAQAGMRVLHATGSVHAKILQIDSDISIIGSHNFVLYGVALGTEEVAFVIKNKTFSKKLALSLHKSTTWKT